MILCCAHSHTTPAVGTDKLYDEWLFRRLCDAATLAMNDRKPVVDVQWTENRCEGMAFVRRYRLDDGTVLIKGAPEKLLPKCTGFYDKNGNYQKIR